MTSHLPRILGSVIRYWARCPTRTWPKPPPPSPLRSRNPQSPRPWPDRYSRTIVPIGRAALWGRRPLLILWRMSESKIAWCRFITEGRTLRWNCWSIGLPRDCVWPYTTIIWWFGFGWCGDENLLLEFWRKTVAWLLQTLCWGMAYYYRYLLSCST